MSYRENHEAVDQWHIRGFLHEPNLECAWCGDDQPDATRPHAPRWFANREGERFCSIAHRRASNDARRRFLVATVIAARGDV